MKLAMLFWFYKDPDLCANRLAIMRRHNPDASIFGLYGGDPLQSGDFQSKLGPLLDDFYVFPEPRSVQWKWYHGDQMISAWYRSRGVDLDWDTIFIAQWDMLVFGRLDRLFRNLRAGQLLISGLRPISEVEAWWSHLRPGSEDHRRYLDFLSHVRQRHGFSQDPQCGEAIVLCLPRNFLERYAAIPEPELGFLEYKIPIYAQIFGTPFCTDHPYAPWWGDDPSTTRAGILARSLNAESAEVPLRTIVAHLAIPRGRRIFHPVFQTYPLTASKLAARVTKEVLDAEIRPRWWRLCRRWS
jgi:hypothetical protein